MRAITIDGQDGVFLSHEEHRDLVDARDHALALGRYRADGIAIPEPEIDAYLAAEVGVLSRIARALGLRIEDLVEG